MTFESQLNSAFRRVGETLGRHLNVTVTEPGTDDFGRPDGTKTVVSSTTHKGRIESAQESNREQDAGGTDIELDVEIWLPDDVDVIPRDSSGDQEMTITDSKTGKTFVPLEYFDEGNSWIRVEAVEGENAE